MAGSREIHQIEYRWQPGQDMSPTASSMSSGSARGWFARIGPWVRHPGVDAPTASVRYEMFDTSGLAALAWRLRDRQAAGYEQGRPLVSRVLVGSADLLSPEVAIAVCHAGLPESVGPRPGTITRGTRLPPAEAAGFTALAEENAEALDEAAARETGLERVIAAALGDRGTPLSVQLPERIISQPPRGGSQALLLWGLRRTVWPLTGHGGHRGWSFSTFELPQSDMDTGTLPDIVFREDQAAPQGAPLTMRKEIRVRPRDPVGSPAATLAQHLARLLVVTYAELGGDELRGLITQHPSARGSVERRMQAIYDLLDARTSPVTVVGDQSRFTPVTARPVETAGAQRAAPPPEPAPPHRPDPEPEPAFQRRRASPVNPHEDREPRINEPRINMPPPAAETRVTAPPPPAETQVTAPPLPTATPATPVPPASLTDLLERLSMGPFSQDFESALHALRAQNFQTMDSDRARARKVIREQDWYVNVLQRYTQASPKDVLIVIFSRAVVPDLAYPHVRDEIADWAGHQRAPDVVIGALYAAAAGAVDTRERMKRALEPALAWRWQADHGFHGPPEADAHGTPGSPGPAPPGSPGPAPPGSPGPAPPASPGPATQAHATGSMQTLVNLLDRKVSVPVPLVLAVIIAVLVLIAFTR